MNTAVPRPVWLLLRHHILCALRDHGTLLCVGYTRQRPLYTRQRMPLPWAAPLLWAGVRGTQQRVPLLWTKSLPCALELGTRQRRALLCECARYLALWQRMGHMAKGRFPVVVVSKDVDDDTILYALSGDWAEQLPILGAYSTRRQVWFPIRCQESAARDAASFNNVGRIHEFADHLYYEL